MNDFSLPLQLRWSDIDANRHLRHSVYYDYGAYCRMALFTKIGLSIETLQQHHVSPILFREEAVFRREILFDDELAITAEVIKASGDYSRWSFRHSFMKGGNTLAATLTVDGAWIDTVKRKLAIPPPFLVEAFSQIPKSKDYEEHVPKV